MTTVPGAPTASIAPREPTLAERRGRLAAILLLAGLVTAFTAVCSVEIILQAWGEPHPIAPTSCREGVLGLVRAVHRARQTAGKIPSERGSIVRFRGALDPEWATAPSIERSCSGSLELARDLEEVVRFRYAEERALRYEAIEVAGRRRAVAEIERRLLPGPTP